MAPELNMPMMASTFDSIMMARDLYASRNCGLIQLHTPFRPMSSQIWIIVAVIALCCVSSSLLTASGGFGLYQYNKTHSTTPWSCIYVPTIKMYTVARSTRTTPSACTTLTTLNLDIYTCGPNSTNYKLWNRTGYEAANDPCDVILNSDNRSIVNMLFAPSTTSINSAYPPPAATS